MEDGIMNQKDMNNEDDEEMTDVEVWEFALDRREIDELIGKLNELKQSKTQIEFDIDEVNELLIHYEDEENAEDEEIEEDESNDQ